MIHNILLVLFATVIEVVIGVELLVLPFSRCFLMPLHDHHHNRGNGIYDVVSVTWDDALVKKKASRPERERRRRGRRERESERVSVFVWTGESFSG